MRTLKQTGSAVSTSDVPPPKKNGRTHGPAEGDDDSAFWEPFPPPVAQNGTDDNGRPLDAPSHEEVDALPSAPEQQVSKPATKQLGLSHFFGASVVTFTIFDDAASSSKSAAKEKEVANKKDVARPVEKKGRGKAAVREGRPSGPRHRQTQEGQGQSCGQ
ncbi:hypothetical protein B0H17DRAFT_1103786 [Mycena rosella]|uniref:Uncharacterized protein n=1 Tax=Mycena rosella TaxID=1033263 RepID=A0AAD7CDT1_MYCRO|nr:hypothetical protein B0H17DRAFT_1103786 [Mycena rosella]